MRQMHQIPCLPEDVYNPLRDSVDGTSVYRHCKIKFSNMTTLRSHINKRICTTFDMHQALMNPIVSRPEVAMHIRHRSYMGLYLDKPLCQELATQCAFCNQQVHAKAMTRHYRDHHQEKIGPTNTPLGNDQRICQLRIRPRGMSALLHQNSQYPHPSMQCGIPTGSHDGPRV